MCGNPVDFNKLKYNRKALFNAIHSQTCSFKIQFRINKYKKTVHLILFNEMVQIKQLASKLIHLTK